MAQDRADPTRRQADPPGASQPDVLEITDSEISEPPPSMASIDVLLELPDEGWDIEDQVRTLKTAAELPPLGAPPARSDPPRREALRLPTPYQIGPSPFQLEAAAALARLDTRIPSARQPLPPPPSRPPPPLPRKPPPLPRSGPDVSHASGPPPALGDESLTDLLAARVGALEAGADRVGLARAQMELAIAHEITGDEDRGVAFAEAALKTDPQLASAHAMLRRRKHGRAALAQMLGHLDHELSTATHEPAKVELLVERARLLDAMGERPDVIRAAWSQALAHAPHHPAALRGLEAEVATRANQVGAAPEILDAWAAHLGHMADASVAERELAAWLHVERAQVLEKRLGRVDAARGALERALELDPRVGPVRSLFVRHVSARGDAAALIALLEEEANIDGDAARSARLELEAATLAGARLSDAKRAVGLLERAASRAPTTASVDRKVLDDLVRLRESAGQGAEASRARRARLRFITDPTSLAHELRVLGTASERLGDLTTAVSDLQRALSLDGTDGSLVETLDRLLAAAGEDEQRVALWLTEAARTDEGPRRARSLLRAAATCEKRLGRPGDAIRHLRTAWMVAPGDPEVLDSLSRLLRPAPTDAAVAEARTILELYSQAVEATHDRDRRIAYLEKIALLAEEVLGDGRMAARTYEDILQNEPDRRGAILGLARTAERVGDDRLYARALLEEARLAQDGVDVLALRTRAATALAKQDPARALHLVSEVLGQEPAHAAARALATRLHEEAGRWELAALSLRARIDHTAKADRIPLLITLAQIEETRLKTPLDALATLQAARALDPRHPVPPEAIARVLELVSEPGTVRNAFEALANDAPTPEERARFLTRAAEIDELRLGDDARAAGLYARALGENPTDEMIADRLTRVVAKRGAAAAATKPTGRESIPPPAGASLAKGPRAVLPSPDLGTLLEQRIDRPNLAAIHRELTFELALLLAEPGGEIPRATSLLESLLADDPAHIPALRTLEGVMRRPASWSLLARVLDRQAEAFQDPRAKIGALWSLVALEEWRLPVTNPGETYRRVLALDPNDGSALEAMVRRELPGARRGDPEARREAVSALRALSLQASEDSTRVAILLRLALLLEQPDAETGEPPAPEASREALDLYKRVMDSDPLSVTATTGVARLAGKLGDVGGAVRAAMSLAELAVEPRVRCSYLIDAAELLQGDGGDASLGTLLERSDRAASLLERALEADPDSTLAAARLTSLRTDRRQGARLVEALRSAIRAAHTPEAITLLGTEIAKVARDELNDLTMAVDATRRVRDANPAHVPSLLTLSELCIAQRAWPEAVEALEAVAVSSRESAPKLTALFALASIYEKILSRPVDTERVLRAALECDPVNPRALRGLLRRLTTRRGEGEEERPNHSAEVCDLLGRLAEVERDVEQKAQLLLQLADLELAVGNGAAAERALIEAVAQTPANTKAFARLSAVCRGPGKSPDAVRYARALNTLLGRGTQLAHVDARWLATLGQIEVESLGRLRDGVLHLQRAVQMDPSLYETRFELASALAKAGAPDEATRTLLALMSPDSTPLLALADPGTALLLLEETLGKEQRSEEALVASELLAMAGELDEGRHAWLKGRRLGPPGPHHSPLDRATLVAHVVPPEGRHPLLDVAAAVLGVEAKVLRADLTELGVSTRDRVSARSGNPMRVLLDRLARSLGVTGVELVVTPNVDRVRVIAHDEPWIVVPRALAELPEPRQVAALGRALTRVALGVPWLEELPPASILGYMVAAARVVAPAYGSEDLDPSAARAVGAYEAGIAKAISRKQRRLLEEAAARLSLPEGRPPAPDALTGALARAELRGAYILSGDLLATVDDVRLADRTLTELSLRPGPRSLATVLQHPLWGDVSRFALTAEATALRRRVGSSWT